MYYKHSHIGFHIDINQLGKYLEVVHKYIYFHVLFATGVSSVVRYLFI